MSGNKLNIIEIKVSEIRKKTGNPEKCGKTSKIRKIWQHSKKKGTLRNQKRIGGRAQRPNLLLVSQKEGFV
jgi:hypothetical protein